jgi:hypothetical protein
MKGDPAMPGSPLTSKPTWSNTSGCSTTSAFLYFAAFPSEQLLTEGEPETWTLLLS